MGDWVEPIGIGWYPMRHRVDAISYRVEPIAYRVEPISYRVEPIGYPTRERIVGLPTISIRLS